MGHNSCFYPIPVFNFLTISAFLSLKIYTLLIKDKIVFKYIKFKINKILLYLNFLN